METFVEAMMEFRKQQDSFDLFQLEYAEAEQSIRRKESIDWKEMLAVLSFAMNYTAKYLSAEEYATTAKSIDAPGFDSDCLRSPTFGPGAARNYPDTGDLQYASK